MQLTRLSGRKACDYVMRKGKVWKGKTMLIRWLIGYPINQRINTVEHIVYLGTYATLKLHKSAVKRNRMRRRCREALRVAIRDNKNIPTIQLLMTPRSSSLSCDFSDIEADVQSFLSQFS